MANIIHITWQEALQKLEGAYAQNTIDAYYRDTQKFVDWCETKKYTPFPLEEGVMIEFLQSMVEGLSRSTIDRRLSSIRRMNQVLGFTTQTGEAFHIAHRRMKRSKPHHRRQAHGINEDLLLRAIAAQPETLSGIRNRAMLSLGYDFLARRSELVALRVGDVSFQYDGTLRGVIRRGKTDPFGRGRLAFGSERSAKLLRRWLRRKPKDIDWLFCATLRGTCLDQPIGDRRANQIIKRAVCRVRGHRPRDVEISGHSLRVGAAQDLLIKGFDTAAIMRAGGWRSLSALNGYLDLAEHNVWK